MGLLLLAGFLMRLEGLFVWQQQKALFFLKDPIRPVMIGADSYYYMDLARDLLENRYEPIDSHRCFPGGAPRPLIPPLLSVLLAGLKSVAFFPLEWLAALLPCVLGLLLVLPVYGLGRLTGGSTAGLIAATVALMFPVYAARTVFGRFDTDCLNVVLAAVAVYVALRLGEQKTYLKRIFWLAGALLIYFLFLWWWQRPVEVSLIVLFPLGVVIAADFRSNPGRALIPAAVVGLLALAGVIMSGGPNAAMDFVFERFWHLLEIPVEDGFPPPALFSGDQRADFAKAWAYLGPGGFLILISGGGGLICLAARQFRLVLAALPLIAVSALSVFAMRFLFFAAPLLGIGTGYVFQRCWAWAGPRFFIKSLLIGTMGIVVFLCGLKIHENNFRQPWLCAWHYTAMEKICRVTEKNAVVWSSYSKGYPLQFYARRATVCDGGFQNGRILYISNRPLAVSSFRLAANWMQFYAAHGSQGLERIFELFGRNRSEALRRLERLLAAGPEGAGNILQKVNWPAGNAAEEILRFIFPAPKHPLYLFIDIRQFQESWYQAGAWDMERGRAPSLMLKQYHRVRRNASGLISGSYPYGNDFIRIDPQTGRFRTRRRNGNLSRLLVHSPRGPAVYNFSYQGGYRFEAIPRAGFGVLADQQAARTVFYRLMTDRQHDRRYFVPVIRERARYQVWRVRGDTY